MNTIKLDEIDKIVYALLVRFRMALKSIADITMRLPSKHQQLEEWDFL